MTARTPYGAPLRFVEQALLFTGDGCLIWPFCRNEKGYAYIKQGGRAHLAPRVVCVKAHGEPPTPQHLVTHSCSGGSSSGCVNPRHLRWISRAEFVRDQTNVAKGEKNGRSKLTNKDVREIRALDKKDQKKAAAKYGISQGNVSLIQAGKIWKHLL